MNKKLYASLLLVMPLATGVAQANLIDETYGVGAGSFELGGFVNNGHDYMYLAVGSTAITGWTVGGPGNGVDWVNSVYGTDTGNLAVDLNHTLASSVSTEFATVVGQIYDVTFSAGTAQGFGGSGFVSAGSMVNQFFEVALPSAGFPHGYESFGFQFTAQDALTTLSFRAATDTHSYGPAIDSVSVVTAAAVPIPASSLLMGLGLIGVLGLGVKRGSAARLTKR